MNLPEIKQIFTHFDTEATPTNVTLIDQSIFNVETTAYSVEASNDSYILLVSDFLDDLSLVQESAARVLKQRLLPVPVKNVTSKTDDEINAYLYWDESEIYGSYLLFKVIH